MNGGLERWPSTQDAQLFRHVYGQAMHRAKERARGLYELRPFVFSNSLPYVTSAPRTLSLSRCLASPPTHLHAFGLEPPHRHLFKVEAAPRESDLSRHEPEARCAMPRRRAGAGATAFAVALASLAEELRVAAATLGALRTKDPRLSRAASQLRAAVEEITRCAQSVSPSAVEKLEELRHHRSSN